MMTQSSVDPAVEYVTVHHDDILNGLQDFLRIPSISTDSVYKAEVERAAAFVADELKRLGFENVAVMPTAGHPVVFGEWLKAGPDRLTVMVYAHYDVQPVDDPDNLWKSSPFEPVIREGRLYARGVADDKMGVWGNLKALEALLEADGELPVNVKVIFEGEEESGSPSMKPFIEANQELLAADLLIISDGGHAPTQPVLAYSARGIVAAEVKVTGPEADFHSGQGGGIVQNPLHVAARIIASFHDEKGNLAIDGAYEGMIPLTDEERTYFLERQEHYLEEDRAMYGGFKVWGDPAYTVHERSTARPTLDVVGMYGGYQDEGYKTIIPAKAGFKVTMRLAPGQVPADIRQKLIDHIMGFDSETCPVSVEPSSIEGWPVLLLHDGPVIDALKAAYRMNWDAPTKRLRHGGSVPLIGMFQQVLNMDVMTLPMTVGGLIHAPNEWVEVESIFTSINIAIHFYRGLAAIEKP